MKNRKRLMKLEDCLLEARNKKEEAMKVGDPSVYM
jgi:hypothetical protein